MNCSIENKLNSECHSIALSFYGLLKDATEDYNKNYLNKLKGYKGLFSIYVDEFTEVFKDAEKKRQSLGNDTLYNVSIKDILKTLGNSGLIFDKNILIEYGRKFKICDYLDELTFYYHLRDCELYYENCDMFHLVNNLFHKENFKNANSVYEFLKSLADHVFESYSGILSGVEIVELNETIQIFTEVLNKFNDLDKNIEMNSETVFYGQPLKIILNDLRKLGLIVDKNSVGFEASTGEIIDIYGHIENIIGITEDFLNDFKRWYAQPLYKECQKSIDEEVKKEILCEHMPALYKILL